MFWFCSLLNSCWKKKWWVDTKLINFRFLVNNFICFYLNCMSRYVGGVMIRKKRNIYIFVIYTRKTQISNSYIGSIFLIFYVVYRENIPKTVSSDFMPIRPVALAYFDTVHQFLHYSFPFNWMIRTTIIITNMGNKHSCEN